jgi:DNA gyrase subunit A
MERPDLTSTDPRVKDYIEFLEAQLTPTRHQPRREFREAPETEKYDDTPLPAEPDTTLNLVTISRGNLAKRTPRHLYQRQHRGGMGVFDIDLPKPDYPAILTCADENQGLLLFTNQAKVFRQPLSRLAFSPVRGKGQELMDRERLPMERDEIVVAALPERASGYIALVSETGRIRLLRHHFFGEHMKQGTALYPFQQYGTLAAVCWTPGDAELFMVTRRGMGIRFNEKLIPPLGDSGIKVQAGDIVAGVASIYSDSGVLILSGDGKGTIRLMTGFAPNKSAGGIGKIAIKSENVVGAAAIEENDDIFAITRLGKIIRFPANEVSSTEGVVQGVNCMALRGDDVVAMLRTGLGQ